MLLLKSSSLWAAFLFISCASLIPLKISPLMDIEVEATPERLTRGKYLANAVMACMNCHSELDWNYWGGGLPLEGTEGSGGWHDKESMGIMGSFDIYFANITPAAIGDWTDGELIRALTEGVNKNMKPLFPIMPYGRYRNMEAEEIYSIVVYIRSLNPVTKHLPQKKIKRMLKVVERTFPRPWDPEPLPDKNDKIAYGKYLATIGDCRMCHTLMTKSGKPTEGMELAGGNEYSIPNGTKVKSANITSDPDYGIGNWTEEDFVDTFKEFLEPQKTVADVNTIMPWSAYAQMTETDLESIFAYLKSVKPNANNVQLNP